LVTIPSLEREQRCAIWCAAGKTSARIWMRARHRIGKFLLRREIYLGRELVRRRGRRKIKHRSHG